MVQEYSMGMYKIILANTKIAYFFLLACLLFQSCQSSKKEILVSLENRKFFPDRQYEIQSQFSQKGNILDISSVEYKSTRGKIEKGIYHTPKEAGKDTITILHSPSHFQKEIDIEILAAPELVVNLDRTNLHCKEAIALTASLKADGESKIVNPEELVYYAQKGKFSQNNYCAPEDEGQDIVSISYPLWNLKKEWQFSIVSAPILSVELDEKHLSTGQKTNFQVYLKTKDSKIQLSETEYTVKAEKGEIKGNSYFAPTSPTTENLFFEHKSGQKVQISLEIKHSIQLEVSIVKNKININEEIPVVTKLYKSGIASDAISEIKFSAKRGKFTENVYYAPNKEGMDSIQVTHIPSGIEKTLSVEIEYSPYQTIETDRFKIHVPSDWRKELSDIGIRAKGPKMTELQAAEITVASFPGLDFLDAQTIKMFFQQQKADSKEFEESGEEEIMLSGTIKATKVILENFSDKGRKSWWILAKHDGAVYILTFTGPSFLFEGEKNVSQEMLNSFVLKPQKLHQIASLKMSETKEKFVHEYFTMDLPQEWIVKKMGANLMIASSKLHHQGKSASIFLMSYQQTEIKNLDISLILLLFRQETVKDPTLKVAEETDLALPHGPAKMIAFEGGKETLQKTWVIATKSNTTAYGILIFAPIEIWNANPDFALNILKSFKTKK